MAHKPSESEAGRALEALRAIDDAVGPLMLAFGIHCPPGCGVCCDSTEVQASVLEMLPVAEEIWARGDAQAWIDKVEEVGARGRCLFFTEDQLSYGKGRCGIYPWRPSVCRLFGNAAFRHKTGRIVFAPCTVIKRTALEALNTIQQAIDAGLEVPVFSEAAQMVVSVEPRLGGERYNVNRAFILALERVGLRVMMEAAEKGEPCDSGDRGDHPTSPKRPKRAA